MTYLTRIAINPYLPDARKLLSNTQFLHVKVNEITDAPSKDDSGRTTARNRGNGAPLWRLDAARDSLSLYILSNTKPKTDKLSVSAGFGSDEGAVMVADIAPLISSLKEGDVYGFHLTANMVRRTGAPKGVVDGKGVSTPCQSIQDKYAWLASNSLKNGFSIKGLPHIENGVDVFTKLNGATVTLDKTSVSGTLKVSDADKLRKALTYGVGRGKAYGCGLLTLASVE